MRKRTVIGMSGILVCMAMALFGCSDTKKAKELEREELLLWSYYETEEQRTMLNQLTEGFNESQERYSLSWEYVPMTEFTRRLAIGVTGEETPDIVIMDNPEMRGCIQQEMLEELTEELSDVDPQEYYPQVWESVSYEGDVYGLPFCCNSLMLIYNREMLEAEGEAVPENMEELYKTAKSLTTDERYGFVMSGVSGEQGAFQLLTWILNTEGNEKELTRDRVTRAYAFVKALTDGSIMDSRCINWTQTDICRKFMDGEAAMMLNGPWVLGMLDEENTPYEVAPIPSDGVSSSVIGGENLAVVKGKNKEGAAEFLEYYNRNEIMYESCLRQMALPAKKELAERMAADERFAQVARMVESGFSRASISNWQTVSEEMTDALKEVILEEKTPAEAAEEINFH